jgi:hypothetical protein
MRQYGPVADDDDAQPRQVVTAPQPTPLIYSNSTFASGGPWDLSLDFGYSYGDRPFQPQVRVVMSWEQAMALRDLLGGMVQRYEKDFGPVRQLDVRTEEMP